MDLRPLGEQNPDDDADDETPVEDDEDTGETQEAEQPPDGADARSRSLIPGVQRKLRPRLTAKNGDKSGDTSASPKLRKVESMEPTVEALRLPVPLQPPKATPPPAPAAPPAKEPPEAAPIKRKISLTSAEDETIAVDPPYPHAKPASNSPTPKPPEVEQLTGDETIADEPLLDLDVRPASELKVRSMAPPPVEKPAEPAKPVQPKKSSDIPDMPTSPQLRMMAPGKSPEEPSKAPTEVRPATDLKVRSPAPPPAEPAPQLRTMKPGAPSHEPPQRAPEPVEVRDFDDVEDEPRPAPPPRNDGIDMRAEKQRTQPKGRSSRPDLRLRSQAEAMEIPEHLRSAPPQIFTNARSRTHNIFGTAQGCLFAASLDDADLPTAVSALKEGEDPRELLPTDSADAVVFPLLSLRSAELDVKQKTLDIKYMGDEGDNYVALVGSSSREMEGFFVKLCKLLSESHRQVQGGSVLKQSKLRRVLGYCLIAIGLAIGTLAVLAWKAAGPVAEDAPASPLLTTMASLLGPYGWLIAAAPLVLACCGAGLYLSLMGKKPAKGEMPRLQMKR